MDSFEDIVQLQKSYFLRHETRSPGFRKSALQRLQKAIQTNEPLITQALQKDLGKNHFEAYASEIGIVLNEIRTALKLLRRLSRPIKTRTPLFLWPSKSALIYEPYGVSLIISPWNYPFQLSMAPLVASIATGNCAVVKPSERSTHTSQIMKQIIEDTFEPQHVSVVLADKNDSAKLLEEPFDKIFFTGSKGVGQIIYEAAAKKMIPATLELGGKNPCIVEKDANLSIAAQRIAWGKFYNAGQTCVAPDYLLVHKEIQSEFSKELITATNTLFGHNPAQSPFYGRLIDSVHMQQLAKLLPSQDIILGGTYSIDDCYMAPTIANNVSWSHRLMEDEIFGPILPLIPYNNLAEVVQNISNSPKPLALYLFSSNKDTQQKIFNECSFGGGCINDTLVHFSSPFLPIGGIGASGIGRYRGYESFRAFSNQKAMLSTPSFPNMTLRYPPFPSWKLSVLKRLMK